MGPYYGHNSKWLNKGSTSLKARDVYLIIKPR